MEFREQGYAHPDALVSTEWLTRHLTDPGIRIIESNEDVNLYQTGHIPGAVQIDWRRDLQDSLVRDYKTPEAFAALCQRHGIGPDTTCIFYGDASNLWACYVLWSFRLFGHERVKLLDGGRDKWIAEGRPTTCEIPMHPPAKYPVPIRRFDDELRAFFEDTLAQSRAGRPLLDVRSRAEFRGRPNPKWDHPDGGVQRRGHVPGARSLPWEMAINGDSTFKSAEELRRIYHEQCGVDSSKDTIVYCRIGERSSHTWFVLTYLLGHERVRNYDGSWTEWGNRVRAPVAREE